MKAGQRAGKDRTHQTERRIAKSEFGLPDRQHQIDQIGVAVMQHMRAARHAQGVTFFGLGGAGSGDGGHGFSRRRSTKAVLMNEITGAAF